MRYDDQKIRRNVLARDESTEESQHLDYSAGISRGEAKGESFRKLRRENMRRQAASIHQRQVRSS
jgi:hypothetical protein